MDNEGRTRIARCNRGLGLLIAALVGGSLAVLESGCTDAEDPPVDEPICDESGLPRYVGEPRVLAAGVGVENEDCRSGALCRHNENTDLFRFKGALYLVHRTAESQILGPNSALIVYRSSDEGASFQPVATLPAVDDRDIRDPIFYEVDGELFIKAITRVRGFTPRDQDVETVSVAFRSVDGESWTYEGPIGNERWGFWRVTAHEGFQYSAAYEDGDLQVVLQRTSDGLTWEPGAQIYGVAEDTPLETELVITPGGRMLAIIRMDGTDEELLGDKGRLRTKLCWADPPFESFDCPHELEGARLDGAVHFWHDGRLFVVARKHLQPTLRKRTSVYELVGDLEAGPLEALEWAELPSASDTAYAGVAKLDDGRVLMSWYSGEVELDQPWTTGMLGETDIWLATLDLGALPPAPPTAAECPNPRAEPPPDPGPVDCSEVPSDPTAACGEPCDEGNDLGVGEYCTVGGGECDDNASATTCSALLNGQLIVTSYVCTVICDEATECGPGASCRCPLFEDGGQICGCIPDACDIPPEAEGELGGEGGAGGGAG
ncbi:MAG: hypothetical protein IPM79_03715 [Polyangiaceae bacterium]|nr:hypothetical protein [Polyangiaceae bacterium]